MRKPPPLPPPATSRLTLHGDVDPNEPGSSSYVGIPSVWGTTTSVAWPQDSAVGSHTRTRISSGQHTHVLALQRLRSTTCCSLPTSPRAGDALACMHGVCAEVARSRRSGTAWRCPRSSAWRRARGEDCPLSAPPPSSPGRVGAGWRSRHLTSARPTLGREYYSGLLRVVNASVPLTVEHKPKPDSCAGLGLDHPLGMYCVPFEFWVLAPADRTCVLSRALVCARPPHSPRVHVLIHGYAPSQRLGFPGGGGQVCGREWPAVSKLGSQ